MQGRGLIPGAAAPDGSITFDLCRMSEHSGNIGQIIRIVWFVILVALLLPRLRNRPLPKLVAILGLICFLPTIYERKWYLLNCMTAVGAVLFRLWTLVITFSFLRHILH